MRGAQSHARRNSAEAQIGGGSASAALRGSYDASGASGRRPGRLLSYLGMEVVMSTMKRVTRCIKSAGDILLAGIASPDDHNITPLVTEFNGRHAGRER